GRGGAGGRAGGAGSRARRSGGGDVLGTLRAEKVLMAVDFYRHSLGDEEKSAVASVLDSLFLTTGQRVYEFESAFEKYLDVPAVVATVHCTASLHLTMLLADVGPGDEVITTPMTFLSSSNAVIYAGAT